MDGCRTEAQRMELEHMLVADHRNGFEAFKPSTSGSLAT